MLNAIRTAIRSCFGFSRSEANGALMLLLIIAVSLGGTAAMRCYYVPQEVDMKPQQQERLDQIVKKLSPPSSRDTHSSSPKTSYGSSEQPADTSLNINDVSARELMVIPQIGEKSAQRIISYRDELGGFTNQAQYDNIPGLRQRAIANLKAATYIG